MPTEVKICGLSEESGVDAALAAGADYIGFVFFDRSPRNVPLARAAALADRARDRARIVALTVDAADAELSEIVAALRPDLLQLHGAESADRLAAVRALTGRPVMKAIAVAASSDLDRAGSYHEADRLLFDAKPPRHSSRPGGNGAMFDWTLLSGYESTQPWFLSGGLDADNVGAAIRAVRPAGLDVSSGVESAPGCKDPGLIYAFVAAVRAADTAAQDAPSAQGVFG